MKKERVRTYKNLLNQPLPISLKSGGISVGAKKPFDVLDSEFTADIPTKVKAKKIKLIKDTLSKKKKKVIPESTGEDTTETFDETSGESDSKTDDQGDELDGNMYYEHKLEVQDAHDQEGFNEKGNDTLTKVLELAELDSEDNESASTETSTEKGRKRRRRK